MSDTTIFPHLETSVLVAQDEVFFALGMNKGVVASFLGDGFIRFSFGIAWGHNEGGRQRPFSPAGVFRILFLRHFRFWRFRESIISIDHPRAWCF
jgi:hypothetical protein